MLEAKPHPIKEKYFHELKIVTSHGVKRIFLSLDDVAKLGIIYLLTKVIDHYMFALTDDFETLNMFPWGKYLFELTLS